MRSQDRPDDWIDMVERTGMEKSTERWFLLSNYNADDSQGVQEASYDNSVDRCYAMPVYNPVLQLLWGGKSAYKSMSWSTSSRERAKLGRLDSEPPLLLREWPPETGRETKKEGREAKGSRRIQANRGEEGRRSGSHIKQSKQGGERSRKRKEKERAEFTHFLLQVFKHYFDWACRIIQLAGLRLSKYHCDSFFSGTIFPIQCFLEESVKTYLGNSFGLWRE